MELERFPTTRGKAREKYSREGTGSQSESSPIRHCSAMARSSFTKWSDVPRISDFCEKIYIHYYDNFLMSESTHYLSNICIKKKN